MQIHKFKIHIHKNGRLFGFGVSPNADWKILFVSSTVLALIVAGLGTYFFVQVNRGEVVGEKKSTLDDRAFDSTLLKTTVNYYRTRSAKLEEIKSLNTPPDPSVYTVSPVGIEPTSKP
jgi:hypothetical protein